MMTKHLTAKTQCRLPRKRYSGSFRDFFFMVNIGKYKIQVKQDEVKKRERERKE